MDFHISEQQGRFYIQVWRGIKGWDNIKPEISFSTREEAEQWCNNHIITAVCD